MPAGEARGIRGVERSCLSPGWSIKDDNEMLQAAAIVAAWNWDACTEETSVDEEVESLRRDMSAACDATVRAPCLVLDRTGLCTGGPRRLQSCKSCPHTPAFGLPCRQFHDEEKISLCYEAYRETGHILRGNIKITKVRSWMDLFQSIEWDPWSSYGPSIEKEDRPGQP